MTRLKVLLRLWAFVSLGVLALFPARAQFIQQGDKVSGTGGVGSGYQGYSVALSADGNTAIVGGPGDNSFAGASWVFTRSGGVWSQQGGRLIGTGAAGNAQQGIAVALSADGNTAIVGGMLDNSGAGAAWVFTRSGGVWSQQGSKLVGTGAVGSAFQGAAVSLSADGNTAILGGYADNSLAGAAWVFTRSGGVWSQQGGKLFGTGAAGIAHQGYSVSLSADGNTAIVGGNVDNANAGAAWVFTRSGGVWSQQGSKLVGTGTVGNSFQGTAVSVSADGNTAIVGGDADNFGAGAAWVFTRSGGVWNQQGSKLFGTGAAGGAAQGCAVSLSADGNAAIVGGNADNSTAGTSWTFIRSGGVWSQQGSKLVGTGAAGRAQQGSAVSISADGNTAFVGGFNDDSFLGAAWVFKRSTQTLVSVKDVPNDQGGSVRLEWQKNPMDTTVSGQVPVTSYVIWRKIPPGMTRAFLPKILAGTVHDTLGAAYDSIATVPAVQSPAYNIVAPTLADSSSSGVHRSVFLVSAQTADPNLFFLSPCDSGYSVDNLAPLAPANAQVILLVNGHVQLTWSKDRTDPDVGSYTVYRSTQDGFTPGDTTRLSIVTDTTLVDSSIAGGQTCFYRVTTVDIHGNESVPTAQLTLPALPIQLSGFKATTLGQNGVRLNWTTLSETNNYGFYVERAQETATRFRILEGSFVPGHGSTLQTQHYSYTDGTPEAGKWWYRLRQVDLDGSVHYTEALTIDFVTSVKEGTLPTEFSVSQNYPNPFNPTTTINIGLPYDAKVSLEVYNTLGQKVANLVDETLTAGFHRVALDASHLASGIYLYRMKAGTFVKSMKLVLLK